MVQWTKLQQNHSIIEIGKQIVKKYTEITPKPILR